MIATTTSMDAPPPSHIRGEIPETAKVQIKDTQVPTDSGGCVFYKVIFDKKCGCCEPRGKATDQITINSNAAVMASDNPALKMMKKTRSKIREHLAKGNLDGHINICGMDLTGFQFYMKYHSPWLGLWAQAKVNFQHEKILSRQRSLSQQC